MVQPSSAVEGEMEHQGLQEAVLTLEKMVVWQPLGDTGLAEEREKASEKRKHFNYQLCNTAGVDCNVSLPLTLLHTLTIVVTLQRHVLFLTMTLLTTNHSYSKIK